MAEGYKWVSYQWNDENLGPVQQALAPATKAACAGKLVWTVWLTRPFDGAYARQAAIESGCQAIALEAEIPAHQPHAPNWAEVELFLRDLPIPKSILATVSPFQHLDGRPWPEKAKPLVDAGWKWISQCFLDESPNSHPDNLDFYATQHLGFPSTQALVKANILPLYGDLSRYPNLLHWDAGDVL